MRWSKDKESKGFSHIQVSHQVLKQLLLAYPGSSKSFIHVTMVMAAMSFSKEHRH